MNINRSAICEVKLIKKPFDSHQIRIDFIGFNLVNNLERAREPKCSKAAVAQRMLLSWQH